MNEIVNVIEIIDGIPSPPKSWITEGDNSFEVAALAEAHFIQCIRENGGDIANLLHEYLEAEYYSNGGYECLLSWSQVQTI
jgi:hypothetical protein